MNNLPITDDWRTLKIICIALCSGVLLFTIMALTIGMQSSPEAGNSTINILRLVHVVVTAGAIIGQKIAVERILSGKMSRGNTQSFVARYRTATIVKLAAFEGSALFGLVLFMLASESGELHNDPTIYLHLIPVLLLFGAAGSSYPTQPKIEAVKRQYQIES